MQVVGVQPGAVDGLIGVLLCIVARSRGGYIPKRIRQRLGRELPDSPFCSAGRNPLHLINTPVVCCPKSQIQTSTDGIVALCLLQTYQDAARVANAGITHIVKIRAKIHIVLLSIRSRVPAKDHVGTHVRRPVSRIGSISHIRHGGKADLAQAHTVAADGGVNAEPVRIAVMVVGEGHLHVAAGLAAQIKVLGRVLFACQDGSHSDRGRWSAEDRRAFGLAVEPQLNSPGMISDPVVSAAVVLVLPEDSSSDLDITAARKVENDDRSRAGNEVVRGGGIRHPRIKDARVCVDGSQGRIEQVACVHSRRHS